MRQKFIVVNTWKLLLVVTLLMLCTAGYTQDLRNSSNMLVGKIEKDGIIRDRSNMSIGKVDGDGVVKDKNNMLIGRVKSDGTVVDRNNKTIGYAKGIPMRYAAVFFFLKMFV